MLQNRVDPLGNIIRTSARGTWMGNRGVLHNHHQEIVRPFKLKAWITCKLEFKGKKRKVMAPDRWTELFFLDEATAFSAGHRPCFECRREDAVAFKKYWIIGNPEYGFDLRTSINEIDKILHDERLKGDKTKNTYEERPDKTPDGTFILLNDHPFLVRGKYIFRWTPFGYEKPVDFPRADKVEVLTPRSVVHAFQAGYMPGMAANA
jgi:hypothetical protein